MRLYHVWSEGYRITGNSASAHYHGNVIAHSFRDACNKLMGDSKFYNSKKLTYWACSLFDNEADARKAFG